MHHIGSIHDIFHWIVAASVALCGCAASSQPPSVTAIPPTDAGTSAPSATDAGVLTTDTKVTSTLLDASVKWIQSVSPDGKRILVSPTGQAYPQGLSLVTRGETTKDLAPAGTAAAGFFTDDGRSVVFKTGGTGELHGPPLNLARADGSGLRLLAARSSFSLLAGHWLYYTDESDTGFSFYRLDPPEGAPELLATFSGAYNTYGAVSATRSPNGESIAYCLDTSAVPPDCYLVPAGSQKAVKVVTNGFYPLWAPDGSWLLTLPCDLMDMAGNSRRLCHDPYIAIWPSPDGKFLATLSPSGDVHLIATETGSDALLPRPGPLNLNVLRPRYQVGFTPDSSRLIAIIGHASFSIPTAGGDWTTISSDHGAPWMSESAWVDISPDSRIIVDGSPSGLVESIDGAPPRAIHSPGDAWIVGGPVFEPAGGLGKGIFFAEYGLPAWMTNADGSGDWVVLARKVDHCQWSSRTVVCSSGHDDPLAIYSVDLFAVTDDAKQRVTLASNVVGYVVIDHSLYYVSNRGGLYVIDDLPRPTP